MPIVKVPMKHKFGIVSLSRAESLLVRKRQADSRQTDNRGTHKSPQAPEITIQFVSKVMS